MSLALRVEVPPLYNTLVSLDVDGIQTKCQSSMSRTGFLRGIKIVVLVSGNTSLHHQHQAIPFTLPNTLPWHQLLINSPLPQTRPRQVILTPLQRLDDPLQHLVPPPVRPVLGPQTPLDRVRVVGPGLL